MLPTKTTRPGLLAKFRQRVMPGSNPCKSRADHTGTNAQSPLPLPELCTSSEERRRDALEQQGQFLARQDRWDELGTLIRKADQQRSRTPGGMAEADLLALGARLDVVRPVQQVLRDPALLPQHAPRGGVEELATILLEHGDDYGVALVVIKTHIDLAWAWRGDRPVAALAAPRRERFNHHMAEAARLLDRFSPFEHDSPALAACRCALLSANPTAGRRVADDYEDLIDLDPMNPRHMRAFGAQMLPRNFGSYQQLEVEARRVALMTEDLWGYGGYAWVYLDALTLDPEALNLLDADLFLEGVRDILTRQPDQHMANIWAAFCGVTLRDMPAPSRAPQHLLAQLRAAFDWILRDHLQELHPLIWGQARLELDGGNAAATRDSIARLGRTAADAAIRLSPHH